MVTRQAPREFILLALQNRPGCEIDAVVEKCSGFTWSKVFLEIDRLSRSGEIRLKKQRGPGYTLTLPSDRLATQPPFTLGMHFNNGTRAQRSGGVPITSNLATSFVSHLQ